MTSDFKDDSLKKKDAEWLEQYLAGKAPLHAEDLRLPSAEELDAAEAAFDEIVAGRQKPARRVPLWAWAAAVAAVLTVAVLLWPKPEAQQPPALMANDAAKAQWFALNRLPDLAFDHAQIIAKALSNAEVKAELS